MELFSMLCCNRTSYMDLALASDDSKNRTDHSIRVWWKIEQVQIVLMIKTSTSPVKFVCRQLYHSVSSVFRLPGIPDRLRRRSNWMQWGCWSEHILSQQVPYLQWTSKSIKMNLKDVIVHAISFLFLIWPVIDHIHLSMCFCNTWPQDVRSVDSKVDSFLMVSWQLIHNSSSALVSQCMEASKLLDSAFLIISWEFKGIPPNATPWRK